MDDVCYVLIRAFVAGVMRLQLFLMNVKFRFVMIFSFRPLRLTLKEVQVWIINRKDIEVTLCHSCQSLSKGTDMFLWGMQS